MRLGNLRAAVAALMSSQRVPHISLQGNTFTLISDAQNKKVITKIDEDGIMYADVHFVDANENISKIFYKGKFSNNEDDHGAPTCFSDDGVRPSDRAQEKQCESCAACPHNVWGSKITELGNKGKSCTDVWKTAVVVPAFDEESLFQLRIPPASLKNWNAFNAALADLSIDVPGGGQREGHIGDIVTRVYFEAGKQGVINFTPVAVAQPRQVEYLQHVQDNGKALVLIGLDKNTPALAAPAQTKAPQIENLRREDPAVTQEKEVESASAVEERIRAQVMAEMAAREQANAKAAVAQEAAKPATTGQPAVNFKKGINLSAGKPAETAKPAGIKGGIDLKGMRTVDKRTGTIIDAEPVKEKPVEQPVEQTQMADPDPMGKESAVAGIPGAQLPTGLQNMLANIMGTK